jgi:hypothetical protein
MKEKHPMQDGLDLALWFIAGTIFGAFIVYMLMSGGISDDQNRSYYEPVLDRPALRVRNKRADQNLDRDQLRTVPQHFASERG